MHSKLSFEFRWQEKEGEEGFRKPMEKPWKEARNENLGLRKVKDVKEWGYSAVWARSPVPRFIFWCPIRQTLGHRGGPGTVATSLYLDMRSHSKSMAEVGLEPWSCLAFGQLHWYFYQVLYIQTV